MALEDRKPLAFMFDIDGTLAERVDRGPYDMAKCETDNVREHVRKVLGALRFTDYAVVLVTGRPADFRPHTERWLKTHGIGYEALYMRAEGDFRPDQVVKTELYQTCIEPSYDVVAVFDDRPRVIRAWAELGIPVFNVGTGEEF